ncbi:MAG: hypothetical protein EOO61_03155 [Hymenobacter sp.]|nr:MAG: hypothetical protein EOO61_03155 [Hymenobacter sp.]
MKRHFFAAPLAATLLLSTLGCSKKDEPATPTTNSNYKLDNTTTTCQATAALTKASSGGISIDYLTIDLITTPQPTTGMQMLHLYFVKPNTQGNTTYTLREIMYMPTSSSVPYYFSVDAATLTTTSNGGFSGTFAGKIINSSGSPAAPFSTITGGTFTNVRPQ